MKQASNIVDQVLSAKAFQTLAPLAYGAAQAAEQAFIGSGGAASATTGDSYASDAAQLPQPNTKPANMSGLPPLQLDTRNGKSFFLEFGADLSGDLPPNLDVGTGGGQQACPFANQKTYAPTFTVNLESIRNRIGQIDKSRYFVSIKFAVDSIYQVIDTALAPSAGTHPTNPNRDTLYKAEPVYLVSEELQQSGERYFVRVPPGQNYLANIDTVAFARLEEIPCQLNFQYPCFLNILPFDRSAYYANSPRISNTRDISTGQGMTAPFYSTQFIREFNIRFQITVDISPNMRPVYSVATAEDAIANALAAASKGAAAQPQPASDPYGAVETAKGGGGAVGSDGGAVGTGGTATTMSDLNDHLQQIHDHFAAIMGKDEAAGAKYAQTSNAIRSAANGVATAASMAMMMSQFAGMVGGAGRAAAAAEGEAAGGAAGSAFDPEGLPHPPNASVVPESVGADIDAMTADSLQAEYERTGFDPATARDMARLRIEAMRNRVRGTRIGLDAERALSVTPSQTRFLEQRPLTSEHARSLPQRVSDLYGRIRARVGAWRATAPVGIEGANAQEMTSVGGEAPAGAPTEEPWFSATAGNVEEPPAISGVDPVSSQVVAPAPAAVVKTERVADRITAPSVAPPSEGSVGVAAADGELLADAKPPVDRSGAGAGWGVGRIDLNALKAEEPQGVPPPAPAAVSATAANLEELPASGVSDTFQAGSVEVGGIQKTSRGRYYQSLLQKDLRQVESEMGAPHGLTPLQAREARRTAILTREVLGTEDRVMTAEEVRAVQNAHRDLHGIGQQFGGSGMPDWYDQQWRADFRDLYDAYRLPSGGARVAESIRKKIVQRYQRFR